MSVFELNKIISSMLNMGSERVGTTVVESAYSGTHYSEQISNFDDVLYSAFCFGLLDMDGSNVSVTDIGTTFAGMMSIQKGIRMLNGTDEQKKFLVECLDGARMHEMCGDMLKKFRVNYWVEPPVWNSNANVFDRFESCMLGIFEDLGIVERDRNIVIVGIDNVEIFSVIKNGLPDSIVDLSSRKKEVGDVGETMAIDYEMKRLKDIKRSDLSDMVKQVSLVDPYVGYDITSFDGHDSDGSYPDRFIEVKSTTGTTPKFFWSRNEINVAQKYGDRYWIYLWTDVEGSAVLHMIQNPYTELFETGEPKPDPYDYVVGKSVLEHANVSGATNEIFWPRANGIV